MSTRVMVSGNVNHHPGYREFIADTDGDIASLPRTADVLVWGAKARVIETGNVYRLNSNYEWVLVPSGDGGGSGNGNSGSPGTTNHAALHNLGFEQSGHTGFASEANLKDLEDEVQEIKDSQVTNPITSPDGNTRHIVEMTMAEYEALNEKDPRTYYDIIDWSGRDIGSNPGNIGSEQLLIDSATLRFDSNRLYVNTTEKVLAGNRQPVTSAGVHTLVGNINTLLEAI